jgi:hypothetical protein
MKSFDLKKLRLIGKQNLLNVYRSLFPLIEFYRQSKQVKESVHSLNHLGIDFESKIDCGQGPEIAVFIPIAAKDYGIVSEAVRSLRANLLNPISRIVICGQDCSELRKICSELDCELVDEDALSPIPRRDISVTVNGVDRSSWIFQQLLKLNVFECLEEKFTLLWDSDTCLIQEMCFQSRSQSVIEYLHDHHAPYFAAAAYLLGDLPEFEYGLTSHKLLVNRFHMDDMKNQIEKNCGKEWQHALMDSIDFNEESSFSEYALYSLYMLKHHPEEIVLMHWKNLQLYKPIPAYKQKLLSQWFKSVSYHNYSKEL